MAFFLWYLLVIGYLIQSLFGTERRNAGTGKDARGSATGYGIRSLVRDPRNYARVKAIDPATET